MADKDLLSQQFLMAMRHVLTSVSVVTTNGLMGVHGATVSSFCSVSAEPPTLLVCLRTASLIAQNVSENKVFCLGILPAGQEKIANRFAGTEDEIVVDRFQDVAYSDFYGCPAIENATSFLCSLTEWQQYNTHTVFFGDVKHIRLGKNVPLAYLDGHYINNNK